MMSLRRSPDSSANELGFTPETMTPFRSGRRSACAISSVTSSTVKPHSRHSSSAASAEGRSRVISVAESARPSRMNPTDTSLPIGRSAISFWRRGSSSSYRTAIG